MMLIDFARSLEQLEARLPGIEVVDVIAAMRAEGEVPGRPSLRRVLERIEDAQRRRRDRGEEGR